MFVERPPLSLSMRVGWGGGGGGGGGDWIDDEMTVVFGERGINRQRENPNIWTILVMQKYSCSSLYLIHRTNYTFILSSLSFSVRRHENKQHNPTWRNNWMFILLCMYVGNRGTGKWMRKFEWIRKKENTHTKTKKKPLSSSSLELFILISVPIDSRNIPPTPHYCTKIHAFHSITNERETLSRFDSRWDEMRWDKWRKREKGEILILISLSLFRWY